MAKPLDTAMSLLTIASNIGKNGPAATEGLVTATFQRDILEAGAVLPDDSTETAYLYAINEYMRRVALQLVTLTRLMADDYTKQTGEPMEQLLFRLAQAADDPDSTAASGT